MANPADKRYKVIINHEEQYSVWPSDRQTPGGWREQGHVGSEQECLDYVNKVWPAMRPEALRLHREQEMRALAMADAERTLKGSKIE